MKGLIEDEEEEEDENEQNNLRSLHFAASLRAAKPAESGLAQARRLPGRPSAGDL